ncbi:NDP-glycosyltransferase YjiC-like [Dermatophagoides pteronyssinus]|uniref:NDP-glycosyltransferase YjiC-like n=1 Tax=Dermatophagoides pteronyssinus TaxID=6956 RepID=UPI003F660CFF
MASQPKKLMKIFFMPMDGVGHINACVGMAQALAKRGHQIYFLTNPMFAGSYSKHGFQEFVLQSDVKKQMLAGNGENNDKKAHPIKAFAPMLQKMRESGMLSGKTPFEKIKIFDPNEEEEVDLMAKIYEEMKEVHPKIVELIEQEKPDLIIVDHFLVPPCIAYGKTPWAFLFSGNPIFILDHPELPPISSGYPTNDRTHWDEFREKFNKGFPAAIRYRQNMLNKDFGYPDVPSNQFLFQSPYLNIYGYPEELDYTDLITLPETYVRLDAFCRDSPESFELPTEFKAKIKPGDKLIYVSMGSMGSIDVDLMKRLVAELVKSPHKYIFSMGPAHDQYELADNMWGEGFLPQTKLLPLVDLVITHGGNNTVTETFSFGKPMIVLPLFGDQYDNAQRITEKGYGNRMNGYLFKEGELCQMIDKMLDDKEMQQRCLAAAKRLSATNSKEKACEKIEQIVEQLSSK